MSAPKPAYLPKAEMLEYFRQVEDATDVFDDVRGRVVYHEDIVTPTTVEWPET